MYSSVVLHIIVYCCVSKGSKVKCSRVRCILDQGPSRRQEMGFTPVTKVLQGNEGT